MSTEERKTPTFGAGVYVLVFVASFVGIAAFIENHPQVKGSDLALVLYSVVFAAAGTKAVHWLVEETVLFSRKTKAPK